MAIFSHFLRRPKKKILHIFGQPNTILKFFIFYLKNYGIISVGVKEYLPAMKTDITLEDKSQKKVLIIDTKYYGRTMQSQFGKNSYHSGNMYQIHSYVSNKKATYVGKVSGLLLYAKTDEEITPNQKFTISGNQFAVQTLDLNVDFSDIEKQLHDIVKFFFD